MKNYIIQTLLAVAVYLGVYLAIYGYPGRNLEKIREEGHRAMQRAGYTNIKEEADGFSHRGGWVKYIAPTRTNDTFIAYLEVVEGHTQIVSAKTLRNMSNTLRENAAARKAALGSAH